MTKGKMGLVKMDKDKQLDNFFGKKEARKEEFYRTNTVFTPAEKEVLKKGHEACLENMPLYEYTKKAILDKAQFDIERRKKIDEVIKDI
jgi:hypothetical protein